MPTWGRFRKKDEKQTGLQNLHDSFLYLHSMQLKRRKKQKPKKKALQIESSAINGSKGEKKTLNFRV